jgi:hypothetical protein
MALALDPTNSHPLEWQLALQHHNNVGSPTRVNFGCLTTVKIASLSATRSVICHRAGCGNFFSHVIVHDVNTVVARRSDQFFAPQLGTSVVLGTTGAKEPLIWCDLVGAVGIEFPNFKRRHTDTCDSA